MLSDPIADMLTRIRNANTVYKEYVDVPKSKFKVAIADVLKREGYIRNYEIISGPDGKDLIRIYLKYIGKKRVINHIKRVSKPGRRLYYSVKKMPRVLSGLGILILTTSKGVLSDREARRMNVGGEPIAEVW